MDGTRAITFVAKDAACSSRCRFSFGSDIHSRMIFRRASCSGIIIELLHRLQTRSLHQHKRRTPSAKVHLMGSGLKWPKDGLRSPSTQLVKVASTVGPCSEIDESSTHYKRQ